MPYIKKIVSALFPALILSLLLSHPRLSADGAQKGLLLWFNTVFPTLFPFMLFSKLLAEHGGVRKSLQPRRGRERQLLVPPAEAAARHMDDGLAGNRCFRHMKNGF